MKLFLFVFLMLISFVAMAQEMSDIAAIMGVFSAIKAGGLGAILAAVYKLASSKLLGTWLSKINPKIHPILILVLGAALGVIEKASQGQPWYLGIIEGSVIGTVAMGIYDTVKAPAAIIASK